MRASDTFRSTVSGGLPATDELSVLSIYRRQDDDDDDVTDQRD